MKIMKSNQILLSFIILLLSLSYQSIAQKTYTLQEIIGLAQKNSPFALQADNRKENRYWQYRTYLSNYNPQLSLSGNLPSFTRSIIPVQQNDGSDVFRERSQFNLNVRLSLSQTIAATGGEIFISSELNRLETLAGSNTGVTYGSQPIQIGFRQPLFAFNSLKWDKRIEPLRYEESQKRYVEDLENISVRTTELFFDLLIAQKTYDIAQKNLANNDTIFKIGKGRFSLGKIAENDLLQLQLNVMNSQQQLAQAQLDIESSQLALKTYLGSNANIENINLEEPKIIPEFTINPEVAIEQAKANREQFIQFKRRQIEAERDVAEAKGSTGLNVNLFGTFGLTQNADNFGDVYQNTQDQQTVNLGFEIPILDWGRRKARLKTALANEELVKSTVAQDEITFEQEIYIKVKQFDMLRKGLAISQQADTVAQRRYYIAQQRYLIAKISITDLNIALQEKDTARRNYLQALRSFWRAYYEMRQLTLYDFERKEPIGGE